MGGDRRYLGPCLRALAAGFNRCLQRLCEPRLADDQTVNSCARAICSRYWGQTSLCGGALPIGQSLVLVHGVGTFTTCIQTFTRTVSKAIYEECHRKAECRFCGNQKPSSIK